MVNQKNLQRVKTIKCMKRKKQKSFNIYNEIKIRNDFK